MPIDIRAFNRALVEEFRANRGVLGGQFAGGDMLLLTATGRRTGERHTTPMMFKEHDGRLFVIASNVGAATHPQWYRNLAVDPAVEVERGAERYAATARTATGAERAELWAALVASHPFFVDHQQTAGAREIPLVVLDGGQ